LLRSQVPIFPTHDYLGQDSPQRVQGAIIDLFHKQVENVSLHRIISDCATRVFFFQGLQSNKFSDTLSSSARLQDFFRVFFFLRKFFTRFLQVLQV